MKNNVFALLFKLAMNIVLAWVAFGIIGRNPLTYVIILGIATTVINLVLGDLFVLPKYGNTVASVGDGFLGVLTALVMDQLVLEFTTSPMTLLIYGFTILVGEFMFHSYLQNLRLITR
ncbi:DUF2512 family protein [Thermosediminibacter oceani]|uniref:Integral membrane protein n=1 Tax=Thermosediminibacter oceani (strain ATCC BAA-1034 / DSM 16646 / JW/IW-1228P) TaxID=555079 RepID=D9S264_THEOJ|nr:DUF2512 family protein [Thermosediminibacter oceani]ADL07491.1 Protein of unknown function DUF2512 [Thermosediminibacter oceani DSM 16646]